MELIYSLNNFMLNMDIDYAVCGGHAIDLFLGKKTRPHKDLDVVVFWEDRDKTIEFMLKNKWDVYEPCGTEYLHKINNIISQKRLRSNIWCVKPDNRHYTFSEKDTDMYAVEFDDSEQTELDYIEFLFNTRNEGYFFYSRNYDIKLELNTVIYKKDNIPYIAPELVLLYKSTAAEQVEYQLDFENTLSKMNEQQIKWLNDSLKIMYPKGHIWLTENEF